jgi:hypothetical protein
MIKPDLDPEKGFRSDRIRNYNTDLTSVWWIRDGYPGSGILIFTHPGSRISDPGFRIQKQQQKRGVKKISCHTFLCSHTFHIEHYFSFEVQKKKIWANLKNYRTFYPKNLH